MDIEKKLKSIEGILHRYVRYLPMTTIVNRRGDHAAAEVRPRVIRAEWGAQSESFGTSCTFTIQGHPFEAILGIGERTCELYQRRVLISDSYDLFNMGSSNRVCVPHLVLRIDAPDLDMVFGRHRVADENILQHLASHLRREILPRFVSTLFERYREGSLRDHGVTMIQAEEIAIAMMAWDSDPSRPWSHLPVFAVLNCSGRPRFSLNELVQASKAKGNVFIADEATAGTDFSAFDGPVLAHHQTSGSLQLLKKVLGNRLVNLAAQNLAIEAPADVRPALGQREKRFQEMLRFHPEALRRSRLKTLEGSTGGVGRRKRRLDSEELERSLTVCEEAQAARLDLESIQWRVGWLVQRDGRTPSRSHRYILKDSKTVLLNLFHSEVERLLRLSEEAPALAGHWALASCLCDGTSSILPELTKEAREDLVLIDGMTKVGISPDQNMDGTAEEPAPDTSSSLLEFLRNSSDPDFEIT